ALPGAIAREWPARPGRMALVLPVVRRVLWLRGGTGVDGVTLPLRATAMSTEPRSLAAMLRFRTERQPDRRAVGFLTGGRADVLDHGTPLSCPLTGFGGRADAIVREHHLRAWHAHTHAACALQLCDAGHFYLSEQRAEVLARIATALSPYLTVEVSKVAHG